MSGLALLLRLASDLVDRLGQTPHQDHVASDMGLILVAVAVQFMVDGLRAAQLVVT